MHTACRITLGLITLYRDATIREYTRARRRPIIRISASAPTIEFNCRETRKLPKIKDTQRSRAAGVPFREIVKLQGNICFLCGKQMHMPTREHVVPRDAGGVNKRNVLAAHSRCNVRKANRMPHPCEILYCEIIYILLDV